MNSNFYSGKFSTVYLLFVLFTISVSCSESKSSTACDEVDVQKYMSRFTTVLKNVTYPSSTTAATYSINSCMKKKGFYVVDINTSWIGNECHIPPSGECEVSYSMVVHLYEDGRLYGYSIYSKNACVQQHEVCTNAVNTTLDILQKSYELSK